MAETTPSNRNTRGILEKRTQLSHDPIKMGSMDDQQSSKTKKTTGVSSDTRITKDGGKEIAEDISISKTLEYYVRKPPMQSTRIRCYGNADVAENLKKKLSPKQLAMFKKTCFGVFLETSSCTIQPQMIKCLMVHEVKQDNVEEFWVLVNGTTLKFSIREFAKITGLKCTGNKAGFDVWRKTPNRLVEQYFPGKKCVSKKELVDCFMSKRWGANDEDAVKIALLYVIYTYIFSIENNVSIHRKVFKMVETGSYIDYPWGKEAFTKLISSIRHRMTFLTQSYRIDGMPLAIQVWLYECCSAIPDSIAVRVAHRSPKILNWEVNNSELQYSELMDGIFKNHDNPLVFSNMTSTPKDARLFPTVQPKVSSTKVHTSTHVDGNFGAFSSTPPMLGKRDLANSGLRVDHPSKRPKHKQRPHAPLQPSKKAVQPTFVQDVQAGATVQADEHTHTAPDGISISRKDRSEVKKSATVSQHVQAEANVKANQNTHMEPDGVSMLAKDRSEVNKSSMLGPSIPKSSSISGDLSSSKTVKGEEYVAPSEDVNPRPAGANLHSPLPVLSANKAQESTSVPSQELKQTLNIQDVESAVHTIQSFLKSLPEKYSSPQTGLQSNSTSSTQTLAKLVFECSIRLPLEALAHDPMNEKEMCSAIAALNENPLSLFSDEQSKQLVKLKYEFPVMVNKWRYLAQDGSRYQEFLTSFKEDKEKLNNWSRLEEKLKSEYDKREEQARELEAILQTLRTRQKEIMEERHEASEEAQKLMLLVQEKVGNIGSTSAELESTKMQMGVLRRNWSNFQSKFP